MDAFAISVHYSEDFPNLPYEKDDEDVVMVRVVLVPAIPLSEIVVVFLTRVKEKGCY